MPSYYSEEKCMGIISKTVKVKWNPTNKKHYENKGYVFTKMKDEFEVKVEDLLPTARVRVKCECDNCKKELYWLYYNYTLSYKEGGKTYCNKCAKKLFSIENGRKTRLKNSKSIAQWLIEEHGDEALKLYWDYEKNTVDPWDVSYRSGKKVWVFCQEKDYHGSYEIACCKLSDNRGCPYCNRNSGKIHPLDSMGQYIINEFGQEFLDSIWSSKNEKSPFEYAIRSTTHKAWWSCPENKHEDYKRECDSSFCKDYRCPECVKERKESMIEEKTRLYLEELGYEVKTEYECSFIPRNYEKEGKNNFMPFDNEIVLSNKKHLIIEVHGEQHYRVDGLYTMNEEELKKRKLYDKYKKEECIKRGYEYLEIPYWYFNKGMKTTYKNLIDNKIKEILDK